MAGAQDNTTKRALVTGAAQGLGAAIALGLARDSFDVVVTSRSTGRLAGTLSAIEAVGRRAVPIELELRSASGVEEVRWPGFGGMVSFRHPEAAAIVGRTELFTLAESLGGVESLIEVPQAMTHQSAEDSAAAVPPDLVRLSCGIEAAEDLVADLERALAG